MGRSSSTLLGTVEEEHLSDQLRHKIDALLDMSDKVQNIFNLFGGITGLLSAGTIPVASGTSGLADSTITQNANGEIVIPPALAGVAALLVGDLETTSTLRAIIGRSHSATATSGESNTGHGGVFWGKQALGRGGLAFINHGGTGTNEGYAWKAEQQHASGTGPALWCDNQGPGPALYVQRGGVAWWGEVKTAGFTASLGRHIYYIDTAAAAGFVTMTMPPLADCRIGQTYGAIDVGDNAATNNITLQRAGSDLFVDGATSVNYATDSGSIWATCVEISGGGRRWWRHLY